MVSVLQNERTQLWFHLHTHMLWENILLSSWTYKKWQVFRLDSRTLPLICRLYNQILCVFHVARTKYKQQSEINSYIKGGQELPDFAALLQQKLWDFFLLLLFLVGVMRMKYGLDPCRTQAAGEALLTQVILVHNKDAGEGDTEKDISWLFVCGQRPAVKWKTIFYLPTLLKQCKAVRENLNAILWIFFVLFCSLPFMICLSSWKWPQPKNYATSWVLLCIRKLFYLLLWYFEKYSQK